MVTKNDYYTELANRDKVAKPVKIKCGQRLDWSVEE